MASILMHIAVSNELYKKMNSKINIDYYDYMLGTIAPDISKQISKSKEESHFLSRSNCIPDIDKFLNKYINTLNNSFNLGYFIHLYTDRLYYRDYFPLFIQEDFFYSIVKKKDKSYIKVDNKTMVNMLYNDYTNLNIQLIDEYNLNLDIFYNEFILPITNITEIPVDKLYILIDSISIIIQSTKTDKEYIIDISSIKSFIDDSVDEIYNKLLSLNII